MSAAAHNKKKTHKKKTGKTKSAYVSSRSTTKKSSSHAAPTRRMSAMTLLEQAEYQLALSQAQAREAQMRDKFHALDTDRSGFIERSELRCLLLELGFVEGDTNQGFERFLEEEFKRSDTSGDGKIDFEEFASLHNRLVDQRSEIRYLNYAISLIGGGEGGADASPSSSPPENGTSGAVASAGDRLKSEAYLDAVHRLASAHKGVEAITNDIVAALDQFGTMPEPEVLQVFTCILIMFGLPEGESPEKDWQTSQALFDGPTFLADLKTFDGSKLRRGEVARVMRRAATLVAQFSRLESKNPLVYQLLSWVLVEVARAQHAGTLDAIDEEAHMPVAKRSSFSFGLGTNNRRGVLRILDADYFQGGFHKKRMQGQPGVTLQLGLLELTSREAVSAIWFDREKFTEEAAGMWWETHKGESIFATALAAVETPRPGDSGGGVAAGNGFAGVPGMEEHWGFNENGEYVRTFQMKSGKGTETISDMAAASAIAQVGVGGDAAAATSAVGSTVMLRAREALEDLTEEMMVSLGDSGKKEDPPSHAQPTVTVVAILLGAEGAAVPKSWLDCQMMLLSPGMLRNMLALDCCGISRKVLRARIKACSNYFLDPGLTPASLRSGDKTVYTMLRWAKAVVTAADEPEAVKAGRAIDEKN